MRKLFTILCAAILTLSVSAQAQFGAVAGLNISAIGTDATLESGEEVGGRTGMHIGGVAHFPLGDVIQLRTGLIYSPKGGNYSGIDGDYKTTVNFNLNYLEIPIEAAFIMGDMFALSAGPYIAFAMSKTSSIESNDPEADFIIAVAGPEFQEVMDKSVSGVDFGLNFGASITVAENFLIGAKYSMGLSNIFGDIPTTNMLYDENNTTGFPGDTWTNGCFSISFAYMLGS
jgi:hypothetical protein